MKVLKDIKAQLPFQPQFLHHSTEDVFPFSHLLFLFQQFFYYLDHLAQFQCRHWGRIQKNSENMIYNHHKKVMTKSLDLAVQLSSIKD